jgi:hypothetical protein
MAATNAITVAIQASKGIAIQAKGTPANIVAYGAAAAVVFVGVAAAMGAYEGGKAIKELLSRRRNPDAPG